MDGSKCVSEIPGPKRRVWSPRGEIINADGNWLKVTDNERHDNTIVDTNFSGGNVGKRLGLPLESIEVWGRLVGVGLTQKVKWVQVQVVEYVCMFHHDMMPRRRVENLPGDLLA